MVIPNFELYEASNLGRIRSVDRLILQNFRGKMYRRFMKGKIIKPSIQNGGYQIVWLRKKNKTHALLVHKLVAMTFLCENSNGLDINHKDGNKLNNNVNNLEYLSRSENIKHSYRVLQRKRHLSTRVLCIDTNEIFNSINEASIKKNINPTSISHVINNRNKTAGGLKWIKI